MIAIFLSIICGITFCAEKRDFTITHFHPKYADATRELLLKNQEHPVSLYQSFKSGKITEAAFKESVLDEIFAFLSDDAQPKRILFFQKSLIGFVGFCKGRETNLESLLRYYASKNNQITEQQILEIYPSIKRTTAECEMHALIKGLVIDEPFRNKGLGRLLFKDILNQIRQCAPEISTVYLDVFAENTIARKLYEAEEFIISDKQLSNGYLIRYKKQFPQIITCNRNI